MIHSLRERRRQMLREEILQATKVLVSEKGYASVSMDELAARVGISKPTLYSYFPTKDDVVVAAGIYEMEQLLALINTNSEQQSPLQHLKLLLRSIIQLHVDENSMMLRPWPPELFRVLRAREDSLACLRRIDTAIVALVQEGIACGEIDPSLDVAIVVQAFYGLAGAIKLSHTQVSSEVISASMIDSLATLFERGVRACG